MATGRACAAAVIAVLTLAACTAAPEGSGSPAVSTPATTASPTPSRPATSAATTTATPAAPATVTIAFGGDAHTEGTAGRVLQTGLGSVGKALAAADLAMVNVETIIARSTSGLTREPKQYTFASPPAFLDVLKKAGVDVVSLANNHGLDFGRSGLDRTLPELTAARPRALGVGENVEEAFRPWRTTVKGRGVVFFAATDVLDDGSWAATRTLSGMASIKSDSGYARMRTMLEDARAAHPTDILVVYLHAGVERVRCPTARQQQIARDLSASGADAIIMSHAHILQPFEVRGRTAVAYGMGNFIFASRGEGTRTGVLTLTFPPSGKPAAKWQPATIVSGVPRLLTGADAASAVRSWQRLAASC